MASLQGDLPGASSATPDREASPQEETIPANPRELPGGSSSSSGRTGGGEGDPERLVGQTLGGRYRLERLLGKGGMGAVFECVDEQDPGGARRALKVVLGTERDADALRRFLREARATRELTSEHVVRVLDAETDRERGLPFIVMELLSGEDLDQLVKRVGPLEPAALCRAIVQACEGLSEAHGKGIIHRDIKPANLFLHRLPGGRVVAKVCDFGVAKRTGLDTSQTSELTQTGGMVGSPMFMSPEQARSAKHVDHRTDVWSLAISMYQALCGRKPWATQSGSLGELILAICTADLTPLQDVAPWIPPGLSDAIHRALLRDPEERYASMAEFRAALEPFAAPPEGLTYEALTSISDSTKNTVAPRATGFGASRSSGSSPLSQTVPQRAPPRSPFLVPALVFAGITGVGVSAIIAVKATSAPTTVVRREVVTVVSVASAPAPPAPPAAPRVSGRLAVKGSPTRVTVNGEPRELTPAGELALEGEPGESFLVEIEAGKGRRVAEKVTLSRDGSLAPPELVILGGPAALASPTPVTTAAKGGSVAPTPVTTATAAATAKPPAAGTVKPRDEF